MEVVRRLRRSLNTKRIQAVVDESPVVLYYTVQGMNAASYSRLKTLLFEHGLECHMMCRNKCLPIHEDDLKNLQKTEKELPKKQRIVFPED